MVRCQRELNQTKSGLITITINFFVNKAMSINFHFITLVTFYEHTNEWVRKLYKYDICDLLTLSEGCGESV